MNYDLPTSVTVCGTEYPIRSDYRAVLDILTALSDPDLNERQRTVVLLGTFYPDFTHMPQDHIQEAVATCIRFINGEQEDDGTRSPRLVDWEQDFHIIVGPVNRVLGRDIRSPEPLHWYTFLSAYMELGDCTFAQVVAIRDKQARHKALDKTEKEWLKRNRHLVDFKRKYTQADGDELQKWI